MADEQAKDRQPEQAEDQSSQELELKKAEAAEDLILTIFHEEKTQERIKQHLQNVIREELSKMSAVMRESIRDWVVKEKEKYNPAKEQAQRMLLDEKLEEYHQKTKVLEDENENLKRKMQLKEHENSIMLSSLQKLLAGKSKP